VDKITIFERVFMTFAALAGAAMLLLAISSGAAWAQERPLDGFIRIPWGNYVADGLVACSAVVVAGVTALLRPVLQSSFLGRTVDQLLERAIQYGINATADAVRGKNLSIAVGNQVLERAAEYALAHAPALVRRMGGMTRLKEKIIARLDLAAGATVSPVFGAFDPVAEGHVAPHRA
jgi:hypothetical protein